MKILSQAMGPYQTNCYIVSNGRQELIIDPGKNAVNWIIENVKKPIAILITHGHSDHIWSNKALKDNLNIPIYCPKDDAFMLMNDFDNEGYPLSTPDINVEIDETFFLSDFKVQFIHYPGHTPGSCMIKIEKALFSGDFIFKGSVGRVDFPFSSPKDMKNSIKKFLIIKEEMDIYPGHGLKTTVKTEQKTIHRWLNLL